MLATGSCHACSHGPSFLWVAMNGVFVSGWVGFGNGRSLIFGIADGGWGKRQGVGGSRIVLV